MQLDIPASLSDDESLDITLEKNGLFCQVKCTKVTWKMQCSNKYDFHSRIVHTFPFFKNRMYFFNLKMPLASSKLVKCNTVRKTEF